MSLTSTYPRYKTSGEFWLGDIPQEWVCEPLKHVAGLRSAKVLPEGSDRYVGMENVHSGNGRFNPALDQMPEGLSLEFQKDDVLFGKLRPYLAKSWQATFNGICSSEFLVLSAQKVSPRFLNYVTLSREFILVVDSSTYGAKMPRASWDFIGQLRIPVPEFTLSKQIAAFLDYETAKIDALIAKQQQLIALLGEKRQAVISHAVTKGLNPDAPMRDSGVEWLGEVPEHWILSQPKYFTTKIIDGPHHTPTYVDEGIPFVTVKNLTSSNGICLEDTKRITPEDHREFVKRADPEVGDLLITKDGTLGVTRVVETSKEFSIFVSVALIKLERSRVNPYFMRACLESSATWAQFTVRAAGAALKHIVLSTIGNVCTPLPPIEEQAAIAKGILERCGILDDLIGKAEQQVELLQERRTALISAAVTGKIDVSGWKPPSSEAKSETEREVV